MGDGRPKLPPVPHGAVDFARQVRPIFEKAGVEPPSVHGTEHRSTTIWSPSVASVFDVALLASTHQGVPPAVASQVFREPLPSALEDFVNDADHRDWLKRTFAWLKAYDPTRLVVDNSPLAPSFHVESDIADYHRQREETGSHAAGSYRPLPADALPRGLPALRATMMLPKSSGRFMRALICTTRSCSSERMAPMGSSWFSLRTAASTWSTVMPRASIACGRR